LIDRIKEQSSSWNDERVSIDRRLLINEKISEDCLERMKLSTSVIDAYFLSSIDIKKFKQCAENVNLLQSELKSIQGEVRETSTGIYKLQANTSTRNEYMELRERIAHIEPVVQNKLPEYFESTKKLVDYSLVSQGKFTNLEILVSNNLSNIDKMSSKVATMDSLIVKDGVTLVIHTEEIKSMNDIISKNDSYLHSEIDNLRNLAGSISRYYFLTKFSYFSPRFNFY
jgi:hypothetical protein